MKTKLLTLFLVGLLAVSCRTDGDSGNSGSGNKINPPSWIIGKWKQNDYTETVITFSKGDIVIDNGISVAHTKPIADLGGYSQTSSGDTFTFTTQVQSLNITYRFKKQTSTKMISDLGLGEDSMDFEFIKQ